MEFRTATNDDVDAIVTLVGHAYRGTGSESGWTTEAHLFEGPRTDPDDIGAILATPANTLTVAVDGGEVVGCCMVSDRGRTAYFGLFAVSPSAQGSGLGKALLAEAERIAHDRLGAERMIMTVVSVRAELIAWYERRGYRRTGEIVPFPAEHTVHIRPGIVLELATLEKTLVGAGAPLG
ncbi:GNAT family N-acetyltransferase [Labedella endophytica]|uniref:GNAT family N-acetyltransferase n=1 Tax=Labedella endophytica TaxID=1523160 RepID=A0A433JUI2_9MICO|nr:GNAT family N-acetyltransferase [Labedella endophytica]RUR01874.1 GNAT family N-acetyltransferase [Labedella endophytica]